MDDDGYSDEEISDFLEKSKTIDETKIQETPAWVLIIYFIGLLTGLVFLIIGITNYLG